ncbi:hypothetical protein [Polaromonas sp. OV174]|uniref:hypothetical protein n=1 Tax=Polaromonas sp. OV174 TaxID=1855300 RepID=UPI001160B7BE|nr:hypothetical protein [Polaromonas sp. OV174]
MQTPDRSDDARMRSAHNEVRNLLSEAFKKRDLLESSISSPSTAHKEPFEKWLVVALILSITSAWPSGFPQPTPNLLFVGACSCTLVALIQYIRRPDKPKKNSQKSAKLRRVI